MFDPLFSLALTMHANPGVFALLLGSGVSRPAGMPTGWEVVLDLLRKVAALAGEDPAPNPDEWYTNKYGTPASYSGVLEAVAKSPAERSRLLRSYFEPTPEEREQGIKLPTKAHHAIAALVKIGMVRVIVTTNFDRLIEAALESQGINPIVVSSPDDVDGAVPLTHSQCTVIKVHGDYLDLRTRNTPLELESYEERVDQLLDRVFDEFGLIISGWSAEWDRALCKAITRAKGRRFSTYWTSLGRLTEAAQHLISNRCAEVIPIEGADEFFDTLAQKVRALVDSRAPHPLSVQAATAQAKRYLSENKYVVRLNDLLMKEIERLIEETSPERYPIPAQYDREDVAARIAIFETLSSISASIIATGCFWGKHEHRPIWVRALNRLVNRDRVRNGKVAYIRLPEYPAVVVQYAAGIGAAAAGNLETIHVVLTQPKVHRDATDSYLSSELSERVKQDQFQVFFDLEDKDAARTERLYQILRGPLQELIPSEWEYTAAFDMFETLQSLEAVERTGVALPGAFMYRYYRIRSGKPILCQDGSPLLALKTEVQTLGRDSSVLKAGFCRGSVERWNKAVALVDAMSEKYA